MMDSCIRDKDDKREKVDTDVSKREISSEFSTQSDSKEREHLKVYLRIRPFTSTENNNGESQDCITIEPPDTVILKPPKSSLSSRLSTDKTLAQTGQRFQFSQVYGAETTQRQLFEGTVRDLVKDVLEGGNSLAFTYGVSNAGKTFTFLGPDTDAGLLPRSLDVIFSSVESRVFTGTSIKPHRCREFTRLNREQQVEEAAFKKNLFRQLKEVRSPAEVHLSFDVTLVHGISLEMETLIKFSIWVSFCEIYNENIHDLLEMMPSGALRRTALRLSQDVKGNTFVKDLRWVQVNSAEEAFKVMKLGKRNQTFSSTKLNQLSSRSHSIFSIRILKIEDVETPRVHTISELCLCDLAGSERCAKTQNKGERLKEAGNINTSLLILGKCINALRHNQQHIPFRESKLTHYLQGFFCGRGKACMIVNISQCASMFDETLNVLKFSAVAQKVVILTSRILPVMPKRSSNEVSFIIDKTERNVLQGSRRTSLHSWESSLEDVQVRVEVESVIESIIESIGQMALLTQLEAQLKRERAENLVMEARIRDEISREFSELFSEMENDFNDRLAREREILEERAERRLEIFKNLIDNMATARPSQDTQAGVRQSVLYRDHNLQWYLDLQVYQLTSFPNEGLLVLLCCVHVLLRMKLVEEKAQNENKDRQVLQLQHELAQRKKQQLISDKQLVQLADKLNQQEAASKQQVAVLRKKLQEQEEMAQLPLDELRARLEIGERKAASDEVLGDLKQKIREQEQNAELLQVELKKASIKHSHSSSNTAVVGNSEARVAETDRASTQANRITEVEESLKQKDRQIEEKLTELQRNLSEKESQVVSLQKSLQQAQEQRDEEESQAVQEARRREAERRRELLAVAHEAIAQKDAELEKKAEEISSSTGCPSVLDSSEISTENGRTSRFPRPELEISFSPLQPNRMALRRQGEENAVTVKITRSARKRKSTEMEKVEAENRRNSRAKVTPKLTPHQEEISTSASRHDSQSSIHSRKEGTLQKIGDFLQSSPTLFGTKAYGLNAKLHKTDQYLNKNKNHMQACSLKAVYVICMCLCAWFLLLAYKSYIYIFKL
uniref:Kinesin family member 20Ba n=1 Tax=Sphaeramia orbicularis TaxID=375764 RepID=A0A672ZN56_9TELE